MGIEPQTAASVLVPLMLQVRKVQSEPSRAVAAPEMLSGSEAIQLITGFVRRQYPVVLFVTLLSMSLGVIHLVTARPSYMAEAQLMIDTRKVQLFQQQSILGDIPIDTAQVESQVQVLKSENIAAAVIKDRHLNEDPEFVSSGGGLLGAIFGFISSEFGSPDRAPPSKFELYRRAVGTFESHLSVSRVGLTYVIQIGFRSYNPERAAEVANAVADAYIVDQLDAKYKATRRASEWLQDRIKELRDQVSSAERAVVAFKTKHDIVSIGGVDKPLLNQQQVAELSSQLTIARAQTGETQARLDRINSVLKTDSSDMSLPDPSLGATVADTLKNQIVNKLRSQYLELAAREAEWSAKYGHNHLAVVNLRNQMREIRNSIFQELKRLGETYKSDYAIALQREKGLKQQLAVAVSKSQATDVVSVTLRELESTAQTYKTIYDNFLQRYMEAVQQQSFPITESRVISAASRPLGKSSPKASHVLALSLLGGVFVGFAIGIFRDLSDRVFRSSEQVENLLHTDCIALVPLAEGVSKKSGAAKASTKLPKAESPWGEGERWSFANALPSRSTGASNPSKSKGEADSKSEAANIVTANPNPDVNVDSEGPEEKPSRELGRRELARDAAFVWDVVDAPLSRFSEAIRSIKLANDLSGTVKVNRVIGVTSSLPNEGKSTIAFSLAQLMAQVGARTILIDCDLRNPTSSRSLAPRAKGGLIDVVADKISVEEAIWEDTSTNLAFLPVVVKFRLANSTEILNSAPMKELFGRLRNKYDYVVVDLPPLAPIVDVRATTHLVDSFLFVIEWGRTRIDVVEHSLGHAEGVYDNLLGVVLNKVDMNRFGRYAGQRENHYYYNKYYARYGYTDE